MRPTIDRYPAQESPENVAIDADALQREQETIQNKKTGRLPEEDRAEKSA